MESLIIERKKTKAEQVLGRRQGFFGEGKMLFKHLRGIVKCAMRKCRGKGESTVLRTVGTGSFSKSTLFIRLK